MPHTNRKKKNVKTSLNPIPLSLRGKKRYVAFELEALHALPQHWTQEMVWKALSSAALHVFGSAGLASQRLQLMDFNPKTNRKVWSRVREWFFDFIAFRAPREWGECEAAFVACEWEHFKVEGVGGQWVLSFPCRLF